MNGLPQSLLGWVWLTVTERGEGGEGAIVSLLYSPPRQTHIAILFAIIVWVRMKASVR